MELIELRVGGSYHYAVRAIYRIIGASFDPVAKDLLIEEHRVVNDDSGAHAFEPLADLLYGGELDVPHVRLVGHSQDRYPRILDGLANLVQGLRDELDDVVGHPVVDLPREPDQVGDVPRLEPLRDKVVGVGRQAGPPDTGPGVVGDKVVLCSTRVYHFVSVDAQLLEEEGELVREGDVDVPEEVLRQLHRVRGLRVLDPYHANTEDGLVEGGYRFAALSVDCSDDPRNRLQVFEDVAGVGALRATCQPEIQSRRQPGFFLEDWSYQVLDCPRTDGALDDYDAPFS